MCFGGKDLHDQGYMHNFFLLFFGGGGNDDNDMENMYPCARFNLGKTIVTDDKGYVCERDSLLGTGCCNTNSSLGRLTNYPINRGIFSPTNITPLPPLFHNDIFYRCSFVICQM